MDIERSVVAADLLCSIFVMTPDGQTNRLTAEYLFGTWIADTILLATPWLGIKVATTVFIAALLLSVLFNPEIPPIFEGDPLLRDVLLRLMVATPLYLITPGVTPGAMTAMMVFLGFL